MNERLDGMQLASIQYHYNDGLYHAHSTIGALLATVIELEADRRALLAVARAAVVLSTAHAALDVALDDDTPSGDQFAAFITGYQDAFVRLRQVVAALPAALRAEMEREP